MLTTLNFSYNFLLMPFQKKILLLQNTILNISSWRTSNFLFLNPAKTYVLVIGLPAQFTQIHNHTLTIHSYTTLKISDKSFYFRAPRIWNALPHYLCSHSHSSQANFLLSIYLLLNFISN